MSAMSSRAAREVLRKVSARGSLGGDLYSALGDTGNAGVLLALIDGIARADAGDGLALVSEASGRVLRRSASCGVPARRRAASRSRPVTSSATSTT